MEDYSIKSIRKSFKDSGVFYTPKELASRLKSYVDVAYSEVYDPTCGRGNLLSVFDDDIKKYGQEINESELEVARKTIVNFIGYQGDTIKEDCFKDKKFDLIVANPPFSIKFEHGKELEEDERFKDLPCLAPKSYADYMFVVHCLHKLKDEGQAIILEFPGILYRKNREGKIRKWLVDNNYIEKVIHIKGDTFVDTSIPTCILILKKNKKDTNILFINTEDEVEHLASYEEVAGNDYNLSVNQYAKKEEEKEIIDPIALQISAHENFKKNIVAKLNMTLLACGFEKLSFEFFLDDALKVFEPFKKLKDKDIHNLDVLDLYKILEKVK